MQIFPLALMAIIQILPESPRFYIYHDREEDAKNSLSIIYGEDESQSQFKQLKESQDKEPDSLTYLDLLTPGRKQFHPTILTIMAQVNQALTGYGAVSVYGPQILEVRRRSLLLPHYHSRAKNA